MTPELEAEIKKIKWWHRIDLGDGVVTPGGTDSFAKLAYVALPEHLDGLRVLDLGAWDGWWSFLCERRGAKEVVAADTWGFDTGIRGFNLARKALDSKVLPWKVDVHNLSPVNMGTFDLVICLGALHHFKNPILALERLHSMCSGKLILETHLDLVDQNNRQPMCRFYDDEQPKPYGDPTCLWGPNYACVEAWLSHAGFTDVKMVGWIPKKAEWSGDRGAFHAKGSAPRTP